MDKKHNSKRRLIKIMGAGGGIAVSQSAVPLKAPLKWSKPVMQSVVLPAHAMTSDTSGESGITSIECSLSLPDPCTSQFMLVGQINGADLAGQILNIAFNGVFVTFPTSTPVLNPESSNLQTTVLANNQFSETFIVAPSDGLSIWQSGEVVVSIGTAQATHTFGMPVTGNLVPLCLINTLESVLVDQSEVLGLINQGAAFGNCDMFLCGAT